MNGAQDFLRLKIPVRNKAYQKRSENGAKGLGGEGQRNFLILGLDVICEKCTHSHVPGAPDKKFQKHHHREANLYQKGHRQGGGLGEGYFFGLKI